MMLVVDVVCHEAQAMMHNSGCGLLQRSSSVAGAPSFSKDAGKRRKRNEVAADGDDAHHFQYDQEPEPLPHAEVFQEGQWKEMRADQPNLQGGQ